MNVEMLWDLRYWARDQWTRYEMGLESEWDQAVWFERTSCGTVCCLAGKAALLAGWEVVDVLNVGDLGYTVVRNGVEDSVEYIAQEALGITTGEAQMLFNAGNTITDVEDIIDRLISGTFDPNVWQAERLQRAVAAMQAQTAPAVPETDAVGIG